jgi:Holliday junction DNA helicase RuvA
MIDSLHGKLLESEEDFAVVDVNGLRFRAEIPASTARQLGATGTDVTLLTRMRLNVNEGDFLLFGFASESERECFDIFTSISGIGPRKGMMMLSQIEIAGFARAIIANDLAYLSRIKGIGRKTAERLVVELREKMVPYIKSDVKSASGVNLPDTAGVRDAVEALIVLGCRPVVAEKAIAEAIKELGKEAKTEELIRAGLKHR